jgi:integrase
MRRAHRASSWDKVVSFECLLFGRSGRAFNGPWPQPVVTGVTGTPHMLRHAYATALIQSAENTKTVCSLMDHFSVSSTMDQYTDAWPEALLDAGENAAALVFAVSG